jgi:transcriptional regulator of acetoin/glycerol metabolism
LPGSVPRVGAHRHDSDHQCHDRGFDRKTLYRRIERYQIDL